MSPGPLPSYLVTEFVERLALGDRAGAVSRALELLDEGLTKGDVRELVRRAQLEVGRLWQSNTWTVTQEHIATGISESVLHAIGTATPTREDRGHVVVVCADGEWHVLPARLLAEDLVEAGFRVTFAGGSVPPEDLVGTIEQLAPDAVAVSCTLSINLAGAARTVAAVHAGGRPVLAGGAAFGEDGARAVAVGADGWARTSADAVEQLDAWVGASPELKPGRAATGAEVERLFRTEAGLVEAAFVRLVDRFPDVARYSPWQVERTREDLAFHLRYLASAVLVDDDHVYLEMLPWLIGLLEARGVPARAVDVSVDILAELTDEEDLPESRRILELARAGRH